MPATFAEILSAKMYHQIMKLENVLSKLLKFIKALVLDVAL